MPIEQVSIQIQDALGRFHTFEQSIEIAEPDFFVDSVNGSDSNDGLTAETAFATWDKAITDAATGDVVGLKRGQSHAPNVAQDTKETENVPFGSGGKPISDARQNLSGKTWTLESGSTWKTTVTLTDATVPNGNSTNTTYLGLWHGGAFAEWMVGGADIAANIAAVDGASGLAFAANVTGSTVEDIRDDAAATNLDVYVKLADGSDPNGESVLFSDIESANFFKGGRASNIKFIGAFRKDATGITSTNYGGPVITFEDCEFLDSGEHGWVGPANGVGTLTVTGAPRKGMSLYDVGRANGAGINIFTNAFVSDRDLIFETVDVSDHAIAVFGHGSGNQGYRNVSIAQLTADNVTKAIQMDAAGASLSPFIVGSLTVSNVTITNVDQAFLVDAQWAINGGTVSFDSSPFDTSNQRLVTFTGTAPQLTLKDVTWTFTLSVGAGKARELARRTTSDSFTDPILVLDGCTDASPAAQQGRLARGGVGSTLAQVDLRLTNGTTIGDIMDQASGTNYPAALTVEAGCTFGMGDRTGPQIETALSGASVPHTISGDTTIVDRAGNVLSSPGWK